MERCAIFLEGTSRLRSILPLQFQCENAGLIASIASLRLINPATLPKRELARRGPVDYCFVRLNSNDQLSPFVFGVAGGTINHQAAVRMNERRRLELRMLIRMRPIRTTRQARQFSAYAACGVLRRQHDSFNSADDRVGMRPQTALMSYILSGLVDKVVTLRKGKWIGPIMVQFGDACRRVAKSDLA
jgi:hypothetical protein